MAANSELPIIFLMGPTASGKTELAMALRERLPLELISVDASQVYRSMDIGTAKPTAEELARAPHRLIDIRDPSDTYSAADFCTDALNEIADIHRSGRIPLLVGGTIFYFHSLEYGLSELPAADPKIRQRLVQEAEETGWPAMHARLMQADPESGRRIHPNDTQRIQRALEILEVSGQPPSQLGEASPGERLHFPVIKVALIPQDREMLRQKIADRFRQMLAQGLVEEVESLIKRGDLDKKLPAMRMVGYRQVLQYLQGELDYNQMVEKGITATRQLAKRQMTWLRGYEDVTVFENSDPSLVTKCFNYLQGKLS